MATLTYAQSVDGGMAERASGQTRLSCPASLQFTHFLRSLHSCLLVGVGAVAADDPQLTMRMAKGKSPHTAVLDSQLRTPPTARIMARHPVLLCTPSDLSSPSPKSLRRSALEAAGAEVIVVSGTIDTVHGEEKEVVDLTEAMRYLRRRFRSVMVEGGPRVIASIMKGIKQWEAKNIEKNQGELKSELSLQADSATVPVDADDGPIVDQIIVTVCPLFLDGYRPSWGSAGPWPRLHQVQYQQCGEDMLIRGDVRVINDDNNAIADSGDVFRGLAAGPGPDSPSLSASSGGSPLCSEPGSAPLQDESELASELLTPSAVSANALSLVDRLGDSPSGPAAGPGPVDVRNKDANKTRRHVGRAMRIVAAVDHEMRSYEYKQRERQENRERGEEQMRVCGQSDLMARRAAKKIMERTRGQGGDETKTGIEKETAAIELAKEAADKGGEAACSVTLKAASALASTQ